MKNAFGILIEIVLNLKIALDSMDAFNKVNASNPQAFICVFVNFFL